MVKLAIIVYTGVEGPESMGRVMNALETAKEFKENGDPFSLIFDGAGTKWVPLLEDQSHDFHTLYRTVKSDTKVCDYCAETFGVHDQVVESDVEIIAEYDGHPSIRSLSKDGYEVITI
ncbi:hypothetical protein [Halodesulfurarchaeum sp.]|uniref:hypothetical protein n=1 Tax=Halodesulfurarchaeum sp. TaxID=1980530 RepID=UPI002FC28D7B